MAPASPEHTAPLLDVAGLETCFPTSRGTVRAVAGVTFQVGTGEVVGVVGESGSGKSMTALSIMGLVPPPGKVVGGSVRYKGRNLLELSEREMRLVRGEAIAMVFQDAMTALNPLMRVGDQIAEVIRAHHRVSGRVASQRAVELLTRVGISAASSGADSYPHQFSGGMAQRVMIAAALANDPALLIADEPTTALDATTQAQILDLLQSLNTELGMSIVIITHNLGVVADFCHRVVVMYAGSVVEDASTGEIFDHPGHPYTRGLLDAIPDPTAPEGSPLRGIAGVPPDLARLPPGCTFFSRCPVARPEHEFKRPLLQSVAGRPSHLAACWLASAGDS